MTGNVGTSVTEKLCPDCGIRKPVAEFWRNKNTKDGLAFYCRTCMDARGRRSRERQARGWTA